MSKHINVNPDHYKVGGRERKGEDLAPQPSMNERESKGRKRHGDANFIPGAAPVGVSGKKLEAKKQKG
jgi:hypothetical protein